MSTDPFEPLMTFKPRIAGKRSEVDPHRVPLLRVALKARYVQMRAGGDKAARRHLAYIERDGVEQDGSKGRLFDGHGDVERDAFAAPIAGEQRQFRFIISPEDGNELDLRDYTNRLMQRMEKDLGRELRWAAVCHYNTDNPHVHVVVRGVDRRGAEVRIDRGYISEGDSGCAGKSWPRSSSDRGMNSTSAGSSPMRWRRSA